MRKIFALGCLSLALSAPSAHAANISLIAIGGLDGAASDLSGLTNTLESGVSANLLGGLGSGLAWAGGTTFLALPDRGPNATSYTNGNLVDNTTSYIARFQTLNLALQQTYSSGAYSYSLTPTLTGTTLLYSSTPLNYGNTPGLPDGTPALNSNGKYYFTGRSDGFAAGNSLNPNNARFDPEALRVSNDGKSVFIADEYGPYIYQFDRATGERIRTFALPANLAVANLSANGAAEISSNTSGRVANKGMEGLAITPDGKTLIGFMQSALLQDGGDGAKANRIVTIDIASGATKQYAYNNVIGSKSYNSSEILALNDHQLLVLERDGKGMGDGSDAKIKQIWAVDLTGAEDVTNLSGQAALLAKAPTKKLFLDIKSALNAFGITDDKIPAKLEGIAFGQDIVEDGILYHTLYLANDNDFLYDFGGQPYDNLFYVFKFSDADLAGLGLGPFEQQHIPEPGTFSLAFAGLGLLGLMRSRRRAAGA
ncbi:MAG: esterase-like activity of phytase family protein [Rhodocyclaceae bacterium]|jgi:hypothetical protein|nr:esterase-like activity of phytase family protein [Rhodocyclaceae bacterium]